MELRHLRYFVSVAENESFTRAAERLHTTQPSLSRQIRDLEKSLGVILFERSTRNVQLTKTGLAFLIEARQVLAQMEHAIKVARETEGPQQPHLTLGILQGVEVASVTNTINQLCRSYPSLQFSVHSRSSPELITEIQELKLDAALVRPSPQCEGLNMQLLRMEEIVVALPEDHALSSRDDINLKDLEHESIVGIPHDDAPVMRECLDRLFEQHEIAYNIDYTAENIIVAMSLIRNTGAICLLPESYIPMLPRGVVSKTVKGSNERLALSLAWHPKNDNPMLTHFTQLLMTELKDIGCQ